MILGAVADSIRGPWHHLDIPIFAENGGHSMVFRDREGNLKLSMHWPEIYWKEHTLLLDVVEHNDRLDVLPKKDSV